MTPLSDASNLAQCRR